MIEAVKGTEDRSPTRSLKCRMIRRAVRERGTVTKSDETSGRANTNIIYFHRGEINFGWRLCSFCSDCVLLLRSRLLTGVVAAVKANFTLVCEGKGKCLAINLSTETDRNSSVSENLRWITTFPSNGSYSACTEIVVSYQDGDRDFL